MSKLNIYLASSPWHMTIARAMLLQDDAAGIVLLESGGGTGLLAGRQILADVPYLVLGGIPEVTLSYAVQNFGIRYRAYLQRTWSSIADKLRYYEDASISVYAFNLTSPISRFVIRQIAPAAVYKVEDGVCDYLSTPLVPFSQVSRLLKRVALFGKVYRDVYFGNESGFAEPRAGYYFFPEKISKHYPLNSLAPYLDSIRNGLARLMPPEKVTSQGLVVQKVALFIGQSLSEDKGIDLQSEIEFYAEACDLFRSQGYEIHFKPHPRSSAEKLRLINERLGVQIIESGLCPVESLISDGGYSLVAGMWSIPVIYSRKIFGIQAYTLMHRLFEQHENLKASHLYKIHEELLYVFGDEYLELPKT